MVNSTQNIGVNVFGRSSVFRSTSSCTLEGDDRELRMGSFDEKAGKGLRTTSPLVPVRNKRKG